MGPWTPEDEDTSPPELSFCFTIMTDDGNVVSALTAAACDLLSQAGLCKRRVWSCLMVLHETRYQTQ